MRRSLAIARSATTGLSAAPQPARAVAAGVRMPFEVRWFHDEEMEVYDVAIGTFADRGIWQYSPTYKSWTFRPAGTDGWDVAHRRCFTGDGTRPCEPLPGVSPPNLTGAPAQPWHAQFLRAPRPAAALPLQTGDHADTNKVLELLEEALAALLP